jgi:hypothetical protein
MSSETDKYENTINTLNKKFEDWKRYKNQNRQYAYTVSGVIIISALMSALVVNLPELSKENKGLFSGLFSAIVVGAQALEEKFKFKTTEEKYRKAQKDLDALITEIKLDPENVDIETVKKRFEEISQLS